MAQSLDFQHIDMSGGVPISSLVSGGAPVANMIVYRPHDPADRELGDSPIYIKVDVRTWHQATLLHSTNQFYDSGAGPLRIRGDV